MGRDTIRRSPHRPGPPLSQPVQHPFTKHPHRTLLALTVPVLFSLIAEPLTGIADTAFVARLGSAPAAALGVATTLLSSVFWVFNFLGIATQTELAHASGADTGDVARDRAWLAHVLAVGIGVGLALVAWPFLDVLAPFMGADGAVRDGTVDYLGIRLLGAPAVLLFLTGSHALRGVQDMRTPLWIAVGVNVVNVVLDALLIFGLGPFPALGLAGAAWASTVAQWLGAIVVVAAVQRRIGAPRRLGWREAGRLLVVGRDLVLRTGLLLLFLLLATRVANRAGAEAGAAHQGLRQVWNLIAFLLDAFAVSAQSLIGFFVGAGSIAQARRVAAVAYGWGLASGVVLTGLLLLGENAVAVLLVPVEARAWFHSAWTVSVLATPLNALAFASDGIHWGTGDYRYLRDAMLLATGVGALWLCWIDPSSKGALREVWLASFAWVAIRAGLGVARVWPGVGRSPFRLSPRPPQGGKPGDPVGR